MVEFWPDMFTRGSAKGHEISLGANLHYMRTRSVRELPGAFLFVFPLSFPWRALHLLGTGLGGGRRGATTGLIEVEARTVAGHRIVCSLPWSI